MSLDRYRPGGQPQQKIRAEHLNRAAVVYVRQSTRHQVLEHTESTRLQYALAERAVTLGWARSQVTVTDDDLGVSAAAADSRKGFARLVTEVTMGRVGVVLGIEMSRLARSGRDWHQLLVLCSLPGVLLAGPDGVYDPGYYNDRLLLGLKGTMSEALCRILDNASLGYSVNRSRLWAWSSRVSAATTRGRRASSRPGSVPTRIAWTIWTGCAGPAVSPARPAVARGAGGSAMAGMSALAATGAPR